ncbi:MAG: DMSO/selenate family reductase complex B subunit [Thermoanaerobaculia bacterium]
MKGPYAVHFDASACTGCKACQAACKDHNDLPEGILWRRVYEVSGGGFRRDGAAWRNDVFAWNLSLSCNHCERPVCAEVCPTGAVGRREDGVVLLDPEKCMGCRYCEWACPYGAPRFDAARGVMTKCTLCADRLDEGLDPSCVAACPMRALDFGPLEKIRARAGEACGFPLPDPRLTEPALFLTPHPSATRSEGDGEIANVEEVER